MFKPGPSSYNEAPINSVLCRICYDNDKNEDLVTPCQCKGSIAFVHQSCLQKWLAESNSTTCELCHSLFQTSHSTNGWRCFKGNRRTWNHIIACVVITPAAIIITYVCLFSSDYSSQEKFVSATQWTSISLLAIIGILLLGYYFWVYSVIRTHSRMWNNFWQRNYVVRYIPPTNSHIYHPTGRINSSNNSLSNPFSMELSALHPDVEENETENNDSNMQEEAKTSQEICQENINKTVVIDISKNEKIDANETTEINSVI